tara:strand:- start:11649 stop:14012 length:2364 start_codon:yes stop_codon:yes gene_type:complete
MASAGGLLSAGSDLLSMFDPFASTKTDTPARYTARNTGLSAGPPATAATQPRAAPRFAAGEKVLYAAASGVCRPATVKSAHIDDPDGGFYYSINLDGVERQTPEHRLRAAAKPAAHVGCGPGSNTRTLFVAGNFEGDNERLNVVLKQAQPVAEAAHRRGNVVTLAFLGNIVPDVHSSERDPLSRVVNMTRKGERLGSAAVHRSDVILLAGQRELAWLRLVNVDPATREIARAESKEAAQALRMLTPFSGTEGIKTLPGWVAHEEGVAALPESPSADVLAVSMMLKLVSMAHLTMFAPGLVAGFVRGLRRRAAAAPQEHDLVSVKGLEDFLAESNASIGYGLEKLVDGEELTPEGQLLKPAAEELVSAVLDYAEGDAAIYLRKSLLVKKVESGHSADGVWLTPRGFADGAEVGLLPTSYSKRDLRVERKEIEGSTEEWADELNDAFRLFVSRFTSGNVDEEQLGTYLALSLEGAECTLPVCGLARGGATALGVSASASAPFGTVGRRILTDPKLAKKRDGSELVGTLEKWANVNTDSFTPSTFFAIATWCSGTKSTIDTPAPRLPREKNAHRLLYDVSVTLATMLSVRVGEKLVRDHGIAELDGLVGPLVPKQRDTKQPMRLVSFTHADIEHAFVVLLPEKFVRVALERKNFNFKRVEFGPMLAVEGFVALQDEAAVALELSDEYTPQEQEDLRSQLGTRVWSLPKKRSATTVTSFSASDYRALDAMQKSDGPASAIVVPGFTVLHTRTTDRDALSGLHVSIANVPDLARATLDTDTSNLHAMFTVNL